MVFVLQRIDRWCDGGGKKPAGVSNPPLRSLYGPVLYLSVLAFNLAVTLWLGEHLMALTGILIYVLAGSIAIVTIVRRTNRYRKEELAEHLRDYPWSPVSERRGG
jgi:putative membrane protein